MTARVGVRSAATVTVRVVTGAGTALFREFIWSDIRKGMIRLKGLSASLRAVCLTAMLAVFTMMAVFVTNETVRNRSGLMLISTLAGRGLLVPRFLVPTACFMLALGAALVLAGALHAPRLLRVVAVVVYLGIADDIRRGTEFLATYGTLDKVLGWAAMGGVVLVYAVRWRGRPRPVGEFLALFACTALTFLNIQSGLVGTRGHSSDAFVVYQLNGSLTDMAFIATPLLLVAGLDAISFGVTASRWTVDFLEERVHAVAVYACLVALGAWRSRDVAVTVTRAFHVGPGAATRGYLEGLLVMTLLAACWVVVDRIADRSTGQEREDGDVATAASTIGLPFGALFVAAAIGLSLFTMLSRLVASLLPGHRVLDGPAIAALRWYSGGTRSSDWELLVGAIALVAAVLLARRGRRPMAHYLAVMGMWILSQTVGDSFPSLAFLSLRSYALLDLWWTSLLVLTTVWWAARQQLTAVRAGRLLFLFVLTALFRQKDFLSNPFALVLSFSGVGLVVFGLVWGFLTAGGWCNAETSRLSRSGRLFVFLGYELFSITLLSWFTLTHDLYWRGRLTQDLPAEGLALLGAPFLFGLAAVTYAGAVASRPFDDELVGGDAAPTDLVGGAAPGSGG